MTISRETLCGYILEEVLAYLIKNTGYRLLVDKFQDPSELTWEKNGLAVKGRGSVHQVDVLGELTWVPAFTFPLRLFVEAKFRTEKTGIGVIRNAVGAMIDINQNNLPRPRRDEGGTTQVLTKYHYVGAIFSTSGFSQPAMDMALAHGVSLIDLSSQDFNPLLDSIRYSAGNILNRLTELYRIGVFPRGDFIHSLRYAIRLHLNTNPMIEPQVRPNLRPHNEEIVDLVSPLLEPAITTATDIGELFVGMGQGPYMLVLHARNKEEFLEFSRFNPSHNVHITWNYRDNDGRTWSIRPAENFNAYELTFKLPDAIADWVFSEGNVLRAAMTAKQMYFSNITIYRHEEGRDHLIRLNFKPRDIDRREGVNFPVNET